MAEQERLTARDPGGNAYLLECDGCGGNPCFCRCVHFDKVCEKLAGYEEQEEQAKKLLAESEAARAELGRRLAAAQKMNAELTGAQAVMVKEFTAKLEELEQVKAERDAAIEDLRQCGFADGNLCGYCLNEGMCEIPGDEFDEKWPDCFEWRGPQKEA